MSTDPIAELLKTAKTIAVVGLSDNPMKPSYGVSQYMQSHGYKIIPVDELGEDDRKAIESTQGKRVRH